ncbi:MAG: nitrite reductase small subunit NirD [Gammaproteobacteria bacterium]|nr:nitrite reductase small subunit NirD [Gammaproteobacteria bacterium]MCW8909105.1 nitrite reductase small subunit NirD [Gammaproteobacteria bacterium]MCW9005372.1 nitrite reductase small subunit NirD [Gammaproteobacteria bacterium]MCW9056183.1 nitrite reductase small subunit NirD [Gammaproteobacteria bacterium]
MSNWIEVGKIEDIPALGARVVKNGNVDIAVFRNNKDEVFAVNDECPHRKGQLSQGIVHDKSVTCPLHNWKIDLTTGEAMGPDEGCTGHYAVKVENGNIFLELK